MSIEKEDFGPNSCFIHYQQGDDIVDLFAAMQEFILGHGWTLVDQISDTDIVITAPVLNSPEFPKIARIFYTESDKLLAIECYEGWNAETHVGVNKSLYPGDNYPYNKLLVDTDTLSSLFISANERGIVLYDLSQTTRESNNYGCIGVVEISQDDENDPNTYTRFGFFTQYAISTAYFNVLATVEQNAVFSQLYLPRTYNGKSSHYTRVATPIGTPAVSSLLYQIPNNYKINDELGFLPLYVYTPIEYFNFNTGRTNKGLIDNSFGLIGKMFNIFVCPYFNLGVSNLETVNIPVDEYGFFDKEGEEKTFIIFNDYYGDKFAVLA